MVRRDPRGLFSEHIPYAHYLKKNRVDYVEQVEEILAAIHAKGARLFRRPKMSASVDQLCQPMFILLSSRGVG